MAKDGPSESNARLVWSQGDLVLVPTGHELARLLKSPENAFLVASQDCDVAALQEVEPDIELVPVVLGDSSDPEFLHGRHPRKICLPMSDGSFATGDIRRRLQLDKSEAEGLLHPDELRLEQGQLRHFTRWLGKRFTRDPFPDAFNRRIDVQKKVIEKALKSANSKHVTTVLVQLSTEDELPADQDYELAIWFTCDERIFVSPAEKTKVDAFAKAYKDAVAACPGLTLREAEVKSHRDVTMEDLHFMRRFEYDHRTYSGKPGGDASDV